MTHWHTSVSLSRAEFTSLARRLAREKDADLILSAPGYPAETTPVIGVHPTAELVFQPDTAPEDVKRFCFDTPGPALGYVSYTYGMRLRGVPSAKPLDMPLGHLRKYAATLEYDNAAETVSITADTRPLLEKLSDLTGRDRAETSVVGLPHSLPAASLDRAGYEAGVRTVLERILSGYTYQLNLSTRLAWQCPDLDPLALFFGLYNSHPAPFYAWFHSGDHRILSTSPERFLRVEDGHVLSQPIKGTLRFDEYAPELTERLTSTPKEDAELSMIVDLIRNDISANCVYGSVRVANHKSVFAVDNLLQMYSDVHGELRPDRDCLDLFFDAFPGGSITGCPKLSSMAIIEELEPHSRGVYCGSAVIIRDERNMDSSIAIRTGVFDTLSGELRTYAGSGIVVDSNPSGEYEETMAKAEKFLIREAQ